MKKIFAVAIAALLFASTSFAAREFESACNEALSAPEVSVELMPLPKPSLSRLVSVSRATAFVHQEGDLRKKAVLGFTEATRSVSYEQDLRHLQDPRTGTVCAQSSLRLVLGYSVMDLQVARELPENSCPYKTVLEHEQGHVRLYAEFLGELKERVISRLKQELAVPSYAASMQEVTALESRRMTEQYMPVIMQEFDAVYADHAEHDSPEEQQRIVSACDGELLALLRTIVVAQH